MSPEDEKIARKERLAEARGKKTVDTFRVAQKGFRTTFGKHFGTSTPSVETVSFHLARLEAALPTLREALRLARYPKAGNRNPKRFALGLMENLSAVQSHIAHANAALDCLATGKAPKETPEEE